MWIGWLTKISKLQKIKETSESKIQIPIKSAFTCISRSLDNFANIVTIDKSDCVFFFITETLVF